MDIQTKDGILLRNIPDGTPEDTIKERINRIRSLGREGQVEKPPTPFHSSGETVPTKAEEIAANPYTRFAIGAAKPIIGAAQLGANAVGMGGPINERIQQLSDITQKGRKYIGSEGVDLADMAGQMASPVYGGLAKVMPATASAGGRILQGAGMGGAAGAMSPVENPENYWQQKAIQTGVGVGAGAAVPAAWEGAKAVGRGVRNVVQPYMGEWGADRAAGRLLNNVAGDRQPQVIQNLQNPQTIVPGAPPTAGQAAVPAGSPEFSALQQITAQKDPTKYGIAGIEGAQQDARNAAVQSVGQTPADLKAAELVRQLSAKQNYDQAFAQQVKADPQLLKMSQNPFFKASLPDATRLAEAEGINPKTDLTQFLHFVKVSLDKQLTKTGDTALANTEKRAVENVKSELVGWLAQKNPSYENARQVFANQSKPINQMEVGQYLQGKLNNPLDTGERAGVFAQALQDAPRTLKNATGQPRYSSLNQVLDPSQEATVTGVGQDLKRNAMLKALGSEGMSSAREKIGQAIPEAPPTGMFSPVISVARGAYNRLTGRATEKILSDLARNMDNPQKIADMMQKATPMERQVLVDQLMRYSGPAAVSTSQ